MVIATAITEIYWSCELISLSDLPIVASYLMLYYETHVHLYLYGFNYLSR
jgi:hypothetical protein